MKTEIGPTRLSMSYQEKLFHPVNVCRIVQAGGAKSFTLVRMKKMELWQIGKTSIPYIEAGIREYQKRLKRYMPLEVVTILDIRNRGKLPWEQVVEKEGAVILDRLNDSDHLILLDEHGKQFRSLEFAEWIEKLQVASYRKIVFLIGGAYGFSQAVYDRADRKIALSSMTFSHQMVRLFLLEQLYRAQTILRNEPYHHE